MRYRRYPLPSSATLRYTLQASKRGSKGAETAPIKQPLGPFGVTILIVVDAWPFTLTISGFSFFFFSSQLRSAAAHGLRLVAVFDVAFAAGAALRYVALRSEGGRRAGFVPLAGSGYSRFGGRDEGGGWKR